MWSVVAVAGMVSHEESARAAWQWSLGALAVVTALVSAGCSTTSEPGERVYYLVACGGGATGVPNICYAKAEELCPNGYTILSEDYGTYGSEPPSMRVACRRQSAKP